MLAAAEEMEAVAGVAARLGLGPVSPETLSVAEHSIVRLAPLPLVARVRLSADAEGARAGLEREITVARHVAAREAPVTRPAVAIDAGPHVWDRGAMTLWEFVSHRSAGDADAALAAQALQRVHAAFESYDGRLPAFTDAIDACGRLLANFDALPRLCEADGRFLLALYPQLRATLRNYSYRAVPIHGDAHLGNVLMTAAGPVWGDLESMCRGPREWDVACLPESAWPAFDGVDHDLLHCLADLRSLCVATWCWAAYGRSAPVDEAATDHLSTLRARFG